MATDHLILRIVLRREPTDEMVDDIMARLLDHWPDDVTGYTWEKTADREINVILYGKFEDAA